MKTIKPWGWETLWAKTDQYVGKILFVKAGHRLSLQYHAVKEETLLVILGVAWVHIHSPDGEIDSFLLSPGQKIHVPPGTIHRIEGLEPTHFVEVSTTELDDVVRLHDDYNRADKQ